MSIFRSQFDRARSYTETYAGDARDAAWRSPSVIAAVVGGGAAVAAAVIPVVAGDDKGAAAEGAPAGEQGAAGEQAPGEQVAGDQGAWGEGWDAGWDAPAGGTEGAMAADVGGGSWMDRGEYTDAGVGGDGEFFYFIDGDSSVAID